MALLATIPVFLYSKAGGRLAEYRAVAVAAPILRPPYPSNLSAVVGLSGWLPCSKTLNKKFEEASETARRAASFPLLLCHGKGDDVVPYKFGEKSSWASSATGFQDVTFKSYTSECLVIIQFLNIWMRFVFG